jgi:hypothetical protein
MVMSIDFGRTFWADTLQKWTLCNDSFLFWADILQQRTLCNKGYFATAQWLGTINLGF